MTPLSSLKCNSYSPPQNLPTTPRTQFIKKIIRNQDNPETLLIEDCLNRARNSHDVFCKELNITSDVGAFAAFPRFHLWTKTQKLVPDDIDFQDLTSRIHLSIKNKDTIQEELWRKRQEYIGQKSLDFLLKSQILPENTNIIADLFCETGGFLKALDDTKKDKRIIYNTAYGVDINRIIPQIAKRWHIPHPIHTKDLTEPKDDTLPKADFIYISAPPTNFHTQQDADNAFKGIHSYTKKDTKLFLGLSCVSFVLMSNKDTLEMFKNALNHYFDYTLLSAQEAETKGLCEKNCLIADTYGGVLILTPKQQEASSSSQSYFSDTKLNK